MSEPPFILNQPTPEEIARALELLEPEGLLMVRKDLDDLGDEIRSELRDRLRRSFLPVEWANRLQSILLLMHDARAKHPTGFTSRVFLPWIKFRSSLRPNRRRIGREMERVGEIADGSVEETEHFIAVYRSVVSDLVDPYTTLLVACHEVIAGTFADLETSNFKMGEFNKVEFVQSAMRKRGDTAELFRGYNSKVRNAISHAGSHGVTIEGRSVLFRDIKRGPQPVVSTVRWSVDELSWNAIFMAELLDCIDAATEIFSLDCIDLDHNDIPMLLQVMDAAFTPSQLADIRTKFRGNMEKVWSDQDISDERRRELLADIVSEQYRARGMAFHGLRLSADIALITVPVEGALEAQQA
ncbi:hypothetical protein, partial [Candidatus Binatus sp.]|uniref:hypothetical protein n=1 Tax=Candidatus Binatus sp. TaxID=2811406 RepID=UPI003CC51023